MLFIGSQGVLCVIVSTFESLFWLPLNFNSLHIAYLENVFDANSHTVRVLALLSFK